VPIDLAEVRNLTFEQLRDRLLPLDDLDRFLPPLPLEGLRPQPAAAVEAPPKPQPIPEPVREPEPQPEPPAPPAPVIDPEAEPAPVREPEPPSTPVGEVASLDPEPPIVELEPLVQTQSPGAALETAAAPELEPVLADRSADPVTHVAEPSPPRTPGVRDELAFLAPDLPPVDPEPVVQPATIIETARPIVPAGPVGGTSALALEHDDVAAELRDAMTLALAPARRQTPLTLAVAVGAFGMAAILLLTRDRR
jgi:hypothetical protein